MVIDSVELLGVYSVINKTLIDTLDSVNILDKVEESKVNGYIHLVEEPFVLSANIERHTKIVTAHKLSQYVNKIHSVKLEDDIETWLDLLIDSDIKERERILDV